MYMCVGTYVGGVTCTYIQIILLTLWVHSDGVCGSNLVHTVHSTDVECVAGPYSKTSTTIAIIRTQLVIGT